VRKLGVDGDDGVEGARDAVVAEESSVEATFRPLSQAQSAAPAVVVEGVVAVEPARVERGRLEQGTVSEDPRLLAPGTGLTSTERRHESSVAAGGPSLNGQMISSTPVA
jgi:hypothetical protein